MADLKKLEIEVREQRLLLDELNEWSAEIDKGIKTINARLDALEGKMPAYPKDGDDIEDDEDEDFEEDEDDFEDEEEESEDE